MWIFHAVAAGLGFVTGCLLVGAGIGWLVHQLAGRPEPGEFGSDSSEWGGE